ncbi:MAG: glycosyltransferase family 39 protein [Bryobacteraceae bacterium]
MSIRNRKGFSKFYNLRIFHSTSGQAALIFSIALIVRIAVAVLQHAWLHNVRAEMEREAISMASTGVLGNAFSVPTGPSATVPPLYPLIMSVIFRLFGTGVAGESVKVLLTCLVSSLQYALIPWVAKRLGLPGAVGLMAGMLGALTPLNPYIEVQGDFENHLSGLLLLILLAWTEIAGRQQWSTARAFALGIFYGICTLTSPSLAPLCFISFVYLLFRQRRMTPRMPQLAALLLLGSVLVVAPWAARNFVQLGSPILTRSNFGLEFSLANNDLASPLMMENQRLFGCCHPLFSEDEARKVQQLGEVEYNARLKRKTVEWIYEHPARFARLTALRVWYLWVPKAPEVLRTLAFRLLSLLSVIGIVLVWRTNRKAALFLLLPLIVYPLPYYLVQIHFRYRYPFHFIMLLLSCAAVYEFWERFTATGQHSTATAMRSA